MNSIPFDSCFLLNRRKLLIFDNPMFSFQYIEFSELRDGMVSNFMRILVGSIAY